MNARSNVATLTVVLAFAVVGCEKRQGSFAGNHAGYAPRSNASAWTVYQPTATVQSGNRTSPHSTYLGHLSANRYDSDSIANPYGQYGSRYAANSINNPYGRFGSRCSSSSPRNPYSTNGPSIYGADGTYLGKLSTNRYDPDSISNPYGRYGSRYSADSVNNPYGRFGSRYSSESATNPYATNPPRVVWNDD
jgi:hypothetical protein